MKRRDFVFGAAAAGALLPTAGCATLLELLEGAFKRPDVNILSMNVLGMTLDTVKTEFKARVSNPNPFGLSLAGLKYAVKVDGRQVLDGNARNKLELKANGASTTTFPVNITLGKSAEVLLSLLQKNSLPYDLNSAFTFAIPQVNRNVTIPVAFGGVLPVPKLPLVTIKEFKFTNVSPAGIGVRVVSSVKNTNKFEIPVDGFHFDVKLNNRNVLQNRAVRGLRVAAGKTKNVPLEFNVSPLDLGINAVEILQRPRINWAIDAGLKSGVLDMPFKKTGALRLQ